MTTVTPRKKVGWTVVNVLVLLYALIPLLWIISLSFKSTATIADGKFIPSSITFDNYKGIFSTNQFTSALVNSVRGGMRTTVVS